MIQSLQIFLGDCFHPYCQNLEKFRKQIFVSFLMPPKHIIPRVAEISNAKRRFDEIEAENVHILIQPSQIQNVNLCPEGKDFYTAKEPESILDWVEKYINDIRQSLQGQIEEQQAQIEELRFRIDELQESNEKMNGKVDRVLSLLLEREESNSRLVLDLGKLKESK